MSLDKSPQGWTQITVGTASSKIISGAGFPKEHQGHSAGDYPFAKVGDISKIYRSKIKHISTANHYISENTRKIINATIFPKDTIVFPKIGESLRGNYRLITGTEMLFDNNVMGITPNSNLVDVLFLYYFLTTQDFGKFSVATAVPSIRRGDIEAISLLLPPFREQQRIVAKIEELFSELDKGVENLRTAQQQLKVYRQALLKHAFEGKLTADWRAQNPEKLESADALLTRIQQEREARYQQQLQDWQTAQKDWEANGKMGSKPSKPKAPKALPSLAAEKSPNNWITLPVDLIFEIEDGDRGEHYPTKDDFSDVGHCLFLNAKNVTKRGLLFKETSFISERKHHALRKGTLKRGDIIFTSRGTLGNIAIYDEKTPYEHVRINSGMFIIRNYSDMFLPDFIYRYLTSPDITSQIDKLQSGTAQPQLPIREFKSFRFVFPGKPEQEQIILVIEEKLSLLDQLEQTITHSLQQAEALRQSILKKAFSGQLVAQDPNDEPASVLLERIRAERAAQPKARGRKARASA